MATSASRDTTTGTNYETEVDGTTSGEHLMMKFGKNKNLEEKSDNNSS